MKKICLAAAMAGAFAVSGAASAATLIYDQTLIPNNHANSTTFYDDDNDFNESWDFSSVSFTSIDRFELTLEVSGSHDESWYGIFYEDWQIRAQGSASGSSDDLFKKITADGANTFIINAASDTGSRDVFAHSVASSIFTLWLAEESADTFIPNPSITVSSANLKIYGEAAVVPLPASLPLLLAGLGGLAFLRRKRVA